LLLPFVYSPTPSHLLSPPHPLLFGLGEAREEFRGEGFHSSIADVVDGEWNLEQVSAHCPALIGIEITAENAVSVRNVLRSARHVSLRLIAASLV
jgi:hypothetical protein